MTQTLPFVRPARPEDVPGVLPMVLHICEKHRQWDRARFDFVTDPRPAYDPWLRARAVDPRSVFYVAEDNGQLVGYIVGTIEKELHVYFLNEYGFIHDLWVEPDARKSGLGGDLITAAVDQFRDLGVLQVRLETAEGNDRARQVFASYGFRPSAVEMLLELKPQPNTP